MRRITILGTTGYRLLTYLAIGLIFIHLVEPFGINLPQIIENYLWIPITLAGLGILYIILDAFFFGGKCPQCNQPFSYELVDSSKQVEKKEWASIETTIFEYRCTQCEYTGKEEQSREVLELPDEFPPILKK